MDVPEGTPTTVQGGIDHAVTMLRAATDARKCWACGCLRHALDTIDRAHSLPGGNNALDTVLASAREHLLPQRYECLGCDTCYPAVALNDLAADGTLAEHAACPTDAVEERQGWPPLAGAYTVLHYHAPVAVCTLNDDALTEVVASTGIPELAIVGTLHTENLGIERMVSNVIANPYIRFVVVCGADSRQAIGHLPGQSLIALSQSGLDSHSRIIGAKGKRPVLKNLSFAAIEHFRHTREVIDLIGVSDLDAILTAVRNCGSRDPGVIEPFANNRALEPLSGSIPARMVFDPAGYFVIFPDKLRRVLSLEHYANTGVLTMIIEGRTAAELYMTAINRELVSRLDHAAYLGRELARAERALISGERYIQDAAPEADEAANCGCTDACGSSNEKLCS
jgi:tetrahydromethanopterin S-methyltransferase subunit A